MGRSRSRSRSREWKRSNRSRSRERQQRDERRRSPRREPDRRERSRERERRPERSRERERERRPERSSGYRDERAHVERPRSPGPDRQRPRSLERQRPRSPGPDRQRPRSPGPDRQRPRSPDRRRPSSSERQRPRSPERDQRPMPAPERRGPGPCFKCGEEGHISRDCPNAPPGGAAVGGGGRRPCFKCGEEGHIARDCPNPEAPGAGGGRRRRRGDDGGDENMAWGKPGEQEEEEVPDKEVEPEFGLSGALAAETNKVNGVVLLHQEPGEARKPTARWRLYVFKGDKPLEEPLHIHRMSCYLFGRERRVADIPTDHPSCSKQHAVLQFRLTEKEAADGMMKSAVRPYLMDLGSTNGTFINGDRIEAERYVELLEQDVIKFGNSTREYVLIKEK